MSRAIRGNVPRQPGELIGREQLLGSVIDQVRSSPLVVLTGVGGVGKTRLATEVAGAMADEFADGVWIVELGAIVDGVGGTVVADAVATALGIAPQGGSSAGESLDDALAGRRLLLVLDNCEHVLDAAAWLVAALLGHPGELRILVTSRVSLQLAHAQEIEVTPLPLTGGVSSPAVTMFAARARSVRPNFALEDGCDTEEAVVEICRVLDGLPLAIELAAARMAGMGPIDMRDRLGDRFRLLEGPRDAPPRQRSLPDLVRWSVELLDAADREVLERASVFAGGFDLATYTGAFDVVDDVVLLRSLERLVRSSLVVGDHGEGRVRYRLLETIRQHGLDTLEHESLLEAARDAHARYFAAEAATRWARWNGPGWRSCVDWLATELANLRAAFQWSCERDVDAAVDVAAHAALIGTSINQFEPIGWAERLLEPATTASVARLPRLYAAAGYACFVGRAETAVAHAERAVALETEPGFDSCGPGFAIFIAALANVYAGNLDRYLELATAAASLPGSARAFALPALVDGLQASGRVDEALDLLDAAVAAARDVGNPFLLTYALWTTGLTLSKSDPSRALSAWNQGIEIVDQHGVDFFRGFIARDAARLHTTAGDVDASLELFALAIDVFNRAGNVAQLIITLASVPALFDRVGRPDVAATLHATMMRVPASAEHVPDLAELGDHLAVELGPAIDEARAAGRAMDLGQAAAYALTHIEITRAERGRQHAADRPGGLTRRELEILRLVADGLTTREIAERLFISAKTADRHIQNVYTKIGTSTRATATRWAMDHGVVARG